MKLFITFVPQQQNLLSIHYVPKNDPLLEYGEKTKFPIIPVINGYTKPGDEIRMLVVEQDHPFCHRNKELFLEEFHALCEKKQLTCASVEVLEVPFDDSVDTHLTTFQKLIDRICDDDDIHACISFGSKPAPMVMMMALRYARMLRKNTYVNCVAYGHVVDFQTAEGEIYDETTLALLDDIMRLMSSSGESNPKEMIDRILGL